MNGASTTITYPAIALERLHSVLESETEAIERAATILAEVVASGGVVQAFGTGHSRAVTLELCGRAGGLAAIGMLAVKDLVMFGGTDPADILDPTYEREAGLARRIYELADVREGDAFVIVSNSGINSAIVEMAQLAREKGHQVVAITSRAHTGQVASRDGSGARLADLADIVIDNGAPPGDAAVELPDGMRIGGISNFTGICIAQMLAEGICRRLIAQEEPVPVFVSANLPQGDRHNESLFRTYSGRVRPIEP